MQQEFRRGSTFRHHSRYGVGPVHAGCQPVYFLLLCLHFKAFSGEQRHFLVRSQREQVQKCVSWSGSCESRLFYPLHVQWKVYKAAGDGIISLHQQSNILCSKLLAVVLAIRWEDAMRVLRFITSASAEESDARKRGCFFHWFPQYHAFRHGQHILKGVLLSTIIST